jgi:hypothetical protein
MSSAHGAGLMVTPVLMGAGVPAAGAHAGHSHDDLVSTMSMGEGLIAITVHVGAMLLVMGAIALLVYEKLGLTFLRRAWINSDQLWAAGLRRGRTRDAVQLTHSRRISARQTEIFAASCSQAALPSLNCAYRT